MTGATDRPSLRIRRKSKFYWGDWLAPALILVTPFVNFIGYHDYGLLYPESLLGIAILAGIGVSASLLMRLRPGLLRPVLLALALTYVIDVQPDLRKPVADLLAGLLSPETAPVALDLALLTGAFLLSLAILAVLGKNAGIVLTAAFAVMLATTFLMPGTAKFKRAISEAEFGIPAPATGAAPPTAAAPAGAAPPPVVHIVLDEQAGVEGIPGDVPGAAELREEMKAFYLDNGFRLYGGAFSPYYNTENSLSNLLNGTLLPRDLPSLTKLDRGYSLDDNAWFELLGEQGYRIRVYQTDFLNFCGGDTSALSRCTTYPANGIVAARDMNAGLSTKVGLLFDNYLNPSTVNVLVAMLGYALDNYEGDGVWKTEVDGVVWKPVGLGALWSKTILERLTDDLRAAKPGDAFYAHLLLPHRGFVMDEDCGLKPDMSTWYDHPYTGVRPGQRLSAASRSARYVAYFKQIRCTQLLLAGMMAALEEAGVLDTAIVIVHGDHGSRITGTPPLEEYAAGLTRMDMIDSFSTLVAIRSPDTAAGYDASARSVQALFAELALRRPLADERAVFFITPDQRQPGTPMPKHPLPDLRWDAK